ncbi:MAG: hypothetical protein JW958_11535 [Candidatus Eisenbacteria bacterium]|nr:hypothetical protein [Candidatus Eisenbacteria bacterium]
MRWKTKALGTLGMLLAAAVLYAGTQWTVQVKSTKLRKEPKFWAGAVKTVEIGAKLEETGRQGEWIRVSAGGATGWVHESAVTTKKIALSGGGGTVDRNASDHEVSLASKGFTEEVEAEYKKSGKGLDYEAVDRVDRIRVSDEELRKFLEQGKLGDWRGRS